MSDCTCHIEEVSDWAGIEIRMIRVPDPDSPCPTHTPVCAHCALTAPGCSPRSGQWSCLNIIPAFTLIQPSPTSQEKL